MFSQGHVVVTMFMLSAMLLPSASDAQDSIATQCGHDVIIRSDNDTQLTVNVTLGQPQPACSWVIPAFNSSSSTQLVLFSNPPPLACGNHSFTVFEFDPAASAQNVPPTPLTLRCDERNPGSYGEVLIARPGYSMRVVLNTSRVLPADFQAFVRLESTSFADLCPETGRKVMVGTAGEYGYENNTRFSLSLPSLLGRIPNNMTCRWEFRSAFGEVVMLHLKTYGSQSSPDAGVCAGNDRLVVETEDSSGANSTTLTIPYCEDPGVDWELTGLTGRVFVTLLTDGTGGATKDLYIDYWFRDPCPATRKLVTSAAEQEPGVVKGISHGPSAAGQNRTCLWYFLTPDVHVVKLTGLQVNMELQTSCNESQDYLLLDNERRVSLCHISNNGSSSAGQGVFPIWSEDRTLDLSFHSLVSSQDKWFLLQHRAVRKGQCQGNADKRAVDSSVQRVALKPIQALDDSEGTACLWLFRAQFSGHVVVVEVDYNTIDMNTNDLSYDPDTCSYDRFSAYSGDRVNNQTRVQATCRTDADGRTYIVYTSSTRTLLFMYRRNPELEENGFVMMARQIPDPATSGGSPVMRGRRGLDCVVVFAISVMLVFTSLV